MRNRVLKVHPEDNIIVALQDLAQGEEISMDRLEIQLAEDIPAKHKFAERDFEEGATIIMYGVKVGEATQPILKGGRIRTENVIHASNEFKISDSIPKWKAPDVSRFQGRTFQGFHRANGKVGTRNYWLVIPLVFCENRNIKVIREAMLEKLGYAINQDFSVGIDVLISQYQQGASEEDILQTEIIRTREEITRSRLFPQVDGIKFLTHEGGCGGTRQDSEALCRLLAGYITHPNVAGATVLSLGCQNAQIQMLEKSVTGMDASFDKPLYILEQQNSHSEQAFVGEAIKKTFVGLMEANKVQRAPAPLSCLSLGLECGGSDGFSGISANPALGYASDLLVALGGKAILAEFPELNGVEQDLINRCTHREEAEKFSHLMKTYAQRAKEAGSGFDMNPSPGNIKDGLITDAMKSAGAAKKGGTSPIVKVLDYTEQTDQPGLHLLCTPGNDVESTTALAGSGANLIVFTTGLGTPTGNAITPTIKMASNTRLAQKMSDLIDIDAGTIISGEDSISSKGAELLELLIKVASGEIITRAERLGQDDFIPWKRGVSL
ncbi:MAG: altronate dehydratase family protein [Bacteroidota bacterium]